MLTTTTPQTAIASCGMPSHCPISGCSCVHGRPSMAHIRCQLPIMNRVVIREKVNRWPMLPLVGMSLHNVYHDDTGAEDCDFFGQVAA